MSTEFQQIKDTILTEVRDLRKKTPISDAYKPLQVFLLGLTIVLDESSDLNQMIISLNNYLNKECKKIQDIPSSPKHSSPTAISSSLFESETYRIVSLHKETNQMINRIDKRLFEYLEEIKQTRLQLK